MILHRIGVMSAAKISGVVYGAGGLIAGVMVALISLAGGASAAGEGSPAWLGPVFGVGAIVFLPICYGLLGAIGGAIGAFLYNMFSGMVGGIELDLRPGGALGEGR